MAQKELEWERQGAEACWKGLTIYLGQRLSDFAGQTTRKIFSKCGVGFCMASELPVEAGAGGLLPLE